MKHVLGITYSDTLIPHPKFRDIKDPCPVFDGRTWHIYGSGGSSLEENWLILHLTAETIEGPWKETSEVLLNQSFGNHAVAPSVIYEKENGIFHMFLQRDFLSLSSNIDHFISKDGAKFELTSQISLPQRKADVKIGVYDPHASVINGEKYLSYSYAVTVGEPDIFLAKSATNTWHGPWLTLGQILSHEQVPFHNQIGSPDYEWGLEGSQLIELPNKLILLIAVCFLSGNQRGARQRVFFATSKNPTGPFIPIAPILDTESKDWHTGENGHAAGIIYQEKFYLFYQGRVLPTSPEPSPWRYGIATMDIQELETLCEKALID